MLFNIQMGEGIAAEAPHIIKTEGCGSCIIVILYDSVRRVGAMAHVMLPESKKTKVNSEQYLVNSRKIEAVDYSLFTNDYSLLYQFADTAVPALIEEMIKRGCSRKNIIAKIVGGARMFPSYSGSNAGIGEQNVRGVRTQLEKEGIPIKGFDTGGSHGRNVEFYLDSGRVVVKAFEKEDREI